MGTGAVSLERVTFEGNVQSTFVGGIRANSVSTADSTMRSTGFDLLPGYFPKAGAH